MSKRSKKPANASSSSARALHDQSVNPLSVDNLSIYTTRAKNKVQSNKKGCISSLYFISI